MFLFFVFIQGINAQKKVELKNKIAQDTLKVNTNYHPKTYGLRIGADILKPILSYTRSKFKAVEIVADWRLNTRWFFAGELGYTDKTIDEDTFNHTVKGSYIKMGLNYNLYTNWLNMDNELYLGFRYGFSTFSNQLNNYTVFQEGTYFTPRTITNPIEYSNLNSHWVEFIAGIKVQVLNNLYLGFMLNLNKLISSKDAGSLKNTYSPGFGLISQNGNGANINYTVSYRIPLYKK